ncbi:hypothetical protein Amet_1399 [Alkaliphilus metalliredigens QYMF]|uniref:Uncharacterized protein n=1 Tax=Alkaliphilus metalliredigens (strain QYMF) TaxID=293826 RepID=A6TN31_ALKMQ|nr:hypothetical protein [Alkaliphilus metalliredigens]ABR47599.1 hypothetical protein Amet_1399 [Alkaliphilus metalliredigens QYMF]
MVCKIKVWEGKNRYGYIKGEIDSFHWYALVHKDEVDFGIDPYSLDVGIGRVSRLCIYKDVPMANYTKRLIYANYKRQWDVLNKSYETMIKELVNYLERRYSIRLVK